RAGRKILPCLYSANKNPAGVLSLGRRPLLLWIVSGCFRLRFPSGRTCTPGRKQVPEARSGQPGIFRGRASGPIISRYYQNATNVTFTDVFIRRSSKKGLTDDELMRRVRKDDQE